MRATLALLAATAALAGCGSAETETGTEPPRADPGVEDCGSYENMNEPPTAQEREANRCVIAAFEARRPAKLVATLATVEGDPITHYVTVTATGGVEVIVDSTKDTYGGGWQAYTCTGLSQRAGRLEWTGCAETEAPKDSPLTNPQQPS